MSLIYTYTDDDNTIMKQIWDYGFGCITTKTIYLKEENRWIEHTPQDNGIIIVKYGNTKSQEVTIIHPPKPLKIKRTIEEQAIRTTLLRKIITLKKSYSITSIEKKDYFDLNNKDLFSYFENMVLNKPEKIISLSQKIIKYISILKKKHSIKSPLVREYATKNVEYLQNLLLELTKKYDESIPIIDESIPIIDESIPIIECS